MSKSMRVPGTVVIAGASGQLARTFIRRFEDCGQDYVAPDEGLFDITDPKVVAEVLKANHPTAVINCAAYNAVDVAETEKDLAYRVNAEAVGTLAEQCEASGCRFVHFGTDYVFDGRAAALYTEQDAPAPLNVYGASKLEGEHRALVYERALVFRVSWVFGDGEQNFLHKLRQWASGSAFVRITADETSVPCYTEDIVTVTMSALDMGLTGLFHANNSGYASRYEWAKYFLQCTAPDVLVLPVTLAEFSSAAERPHFAAMDSSALAESLSVEIPGWRDAVDRYVESM